MARVVSHSDQISASLSSAIHRGLDAMGLEAVGCMVSQMQNGYGRPIHKTGRLMGSIQHLVENSGPNTVDVGTNVKYAPHVHDGTWKMPGRPFLKDGISRNREHLFNILQEYLKSSF